MRLEVAVAAVLAAESSSVVTARGGSDVQETARLRREAIEAISNLNPKGRRLFPRPPEQQRRGNGRILRERRDVFQDMLRKLPGTTNRQLENKGAPGDSRSDSEFLDLGILPSTPAKEQRKSPEDSDSALPDLGILPSIGTDDERTILKNKLQKSLVRAKTQREKVVTSGDPSSLDTHPDLGIISSTRTKNQRKENTPLLSIHSAAQKFRRRLQNTGSYPDDDGLGGIFGEFFDEIFDEDFNRDVYFKPISTMGNAYCELSSYYERLYGIPACETCQVTYVIDEDGSQTGTYNFEMDCPPNDEGNQGTLTSQEEQNESFGLFLLESCLQKMCETCSVDTEYYQVNIQSCETTDIGDGLGDGFGNFYNAFTQPIAFFGNTYCMLNEIYYASETCRTCQLTYTYDDDGSQTGAYNLEMDCPDAPKNEGNEDTLEGLEEFCSMEVCETCSVDTENFKVDMQNCEMADIGYDLDSIFNETGANQSIGEYQVEALATIFGYYFYSICEAGGVEADEVSCQACGRKPSNETTFSFEINCPSKLSATDNGFGSYVSFASSFCSCPALMNMQCSTCEVNFWEATIDIKDCVPIDYDSGGTDSCVDSVYSFADSLDQTVLSTFYNSNCNPPVFYLQDYIGRPDCNCTFDEATQTASLSCTYDQYCQNIESYCPESIRFCYSDRIDIYFERYGASTVHRCVNVSSPYDFSYCASFSSSEGDGASNVTASNDSTSPSCEMEVDGVLCDSCSLVENEDRYFSFGFINKMDIIYDCGNTVIGTNGPGNLTTYEILDDTFSYFIYKSLPCQGGCDLCGVEGDGGQKSEFMTVRDGRFASEFWKNGTEEMCFDAQLDAMINKQILDSEECQAVRDSAREPCGCKNPNPSPPVSETSNASSPLKESGACSFGNKLTTPGAVLLTMVAASIVNMLLG